MASIDSPLAAEGQSNPRYRYILVKSSKGTSLTPVRRLLISLEMLPFFEEKVTRRKKETR